MAEVFIFFIALAATIQGAEWVGSASIKFARGLGIPQLIIGATLVSLATTLPELSIAAIAGLVGSDSTLALGTVLGSPLVNLGFILGIFFLVSGQRPKLGFYSRALNIFLLVSLALFAFSFYQPLGGLISLVLIFVGIGFIFLEIALSRARINWSENESNRFENLLNIFSSTKIRFVFFEFIAGALLLTVGSRYLIGATVAIASSLKIDELFISVTLLAVGTSLPELITTFVSIVKKRENLAIGTLVGASVIDMTLGVGLATLSHATSLTYLNNLLVFTPLLVIGILSLAIVWKKPSVKLLGGLLLATAAIFLAIFSLYQVI